MLSAYDSRKMTLTTSNGEEYYFYTGRETLCGAGIFISRLLERGFKPTHKTELMEMYSDLCHLKKEK